MSLQQAMQAAKDAAANTPAVQDEDTPGTDLAPAGYGMGLTDFLSGNMQVDSWIQVKDAGIRLDRDDKSFITEFEAELDISSVQLFVGLRAEFAGNQVEYRQSFDGGKTTNRGEPFAEVHRKWKSTSVKGCEPYRGANMTLILTDEVKQGKATLPAGHKLGYTTSVTGFYPFQELLKELTARDEVSDAGGGRLSGGRVRVRCVHETKTNKQKQDYGVISFELLD